ncbi:MAG: 1-deoxy-D-xylulose-5-phosphate reductoisomerase [Acutalibacteraceae bacterium]|nr:1-deoxy-D-xylulose-5-phosphate reductoisomerase [Acutalibacteraceae bacterium]
MKKLSLLGSTGSIGKQTLELTDNLDYQVLCLTANKNIELLEQQTRRYKPEFVAVADEKSAKQFKENTKDLNYTLLTGIDGVCEAASLDDADIVLNSLVGMVGLKPTIAAVNAKKDLALANKETLVAGGDFIMNLIKQSGIKLLPVDSEHSAIFQSLNAAPKSRIINKIILTASGGPFRNKTKKDLKDVSVEQALKHPNWSMGAKITIDSSTLMNKGLEVIEAVRLFDVKASQIEVVVHPESILHSAVEFSDGAVIGQMGVPDMKIPIQYALTYPERGSIPCKPLSLTEVGNLSFYKPDFETFLCLKTCIDAVNEGGLKPVAANGANEQAVALFLDRKIKFLQIGELVKAATDNQKADEITSLNDILDADKKAREFVLSRV